MRMIKTAAWPVACVLLSVAIWIGCAGTPTKLETKLFNVETNYIASTNEVISVAPDGTRTTNFIESTKPVYIYSKGPGETQITQIGTETGNIFGVGGLVGTALGALFGAWRWVRGTKAAATANNLAQSVEMIREFVKQLPNGSTYDNELVNWLTMHQAEAGVLQSVITILRDQVNNPEAKAAADQVMETIKNLGKKSGSL